MIEDMNNMSWNRYSSEYIKSTKFDDKLLHLGLGLPGIDISWLIEDNMKILDVGCGEGTNTNILARMTNSIVQGIDLAHSAIVSAQEKFERDNMNFLCCDFLTFASSSTISDFDLVTFFGSLDYLELDDTFFSCLSKITNQHSKCIISKFHPFWTTLYKNDIECVNVSNYFCNGRKDIVIYGKDNCYKFTRYHYTISYLLEIFKKYSWHLVKLSEPQPDFASSAFEYQGYNTDDTLTQRLSKIPMTLVLIFEKGSVSDEPD